MCVPGNQDGGSYDKADATGDANFKFGLDVLDTGLKFFGNRKKVSRQNTLLKQQHADKVYEYNLKNKLDAVQWNHEILDNEGEKQSEYIKAIDNIAKGQLEIWNSARDTGNAVAASYAKMLSVGMGEQAGRRGGGTAMLKAIQERGAEMADLGAKLSGTAAQQTLANARSADEYRRTAFAGDVETAMGRPIPGTPPILRKSELHQQESPLSMVSGIGTGWLNRKATLREFSPPDAYDNKDTISGVDPDAWDIEGDPGRWEYDGSVGDFGTNTYKIG